MVAAAHKRTAHDAAEAEFERMRLPGVEFLGRHVPDERMMILRGRQILPERQQRHSGVAQFRQRFADFRLGLPKSEHHAGLHRDAFAQPHGRA